MYTPAFNEEKRLPVLHDHMRAHPLATLVTLTADGLLATHLPLIRGLPELDTPDSRAMQARIPR